MIPPRAPAATDMGADRHVDPEIVRTPDRRLRGLLAQLPRLRADLGRAPRHALRLLAHDLRGRALGTPLGLAAAFAPAIVVALWATLAARARWLAPGDLALPYPAWVLLSVILWQAFAESLQLQVDGLAAERSVLAKVDLPAEALVLARLGEALLQLGFKVAVGLALVALFRVDLPATTLLLPLLALPLALLGTAAGLWLAPLAALYPPLARALPAATTAGFFLTPVLFPVPDRGLLRAIVLVNPVTPLLSLARDASLGLGVSHPAALAAALALTIVLLAVGWLFYRLALPYVLERAEA